jgi:biotin transport system substrate-specific component
MNASTSSSTLVDVLFANDVVARPSRAVKVGSVLFMTALTATAAQISVPLPFTQVPFTFQPMVVLLAGLTLGSRLGMASQILYLALGVAGLPVFAASATLPPGAMRLLGPTGGYLMAYPFAAWLTGALAERGFDRRYVTSFFAMLAGLATIYACGAAWLGVTAGWSQAIALGIAPFVLADVAKLLAAAGVLPTLWKIVGADRADHRRQ